MTNPLLPVPSIRPQNLGTMQAMRKIVRSQIGYRESGDNDNIFGALAGLNHLPYCGIGMSWAAKLAGCGKITPDGAYTPALAGWFKDKGRFHTHGPVAGDWHFVYHASMGRIGHVEFVEKVLDGESFLVIGWNTSNTGSRQGTGVFRLKRSAVSVHGGLGRPNYKPYTP